MDLQRCPAALGAGDTLFRIDSSMRRHLFLVLLLAWPAAAFGQAPDRPNFIVLFADDQGWGDLGV